MNKYVNWEHENKEQKPETWDVIMNTIIDCENIPFTTIAEKLFEAKI